MRSQLLGRVSGVAALQTNKQTQDDILVSDSEENNFSECLAPN